MEGPHINMKLIIGNRESGTGNWLLVLYLVNVWDISKLLIGNRESGTGNYFHVPYFGMKFQCFKSANRE